jgi:hypothetical protein
MINLSTQFCLLTEILEGMDVPDIRRELTKANLRWLGRNLSVRNGEHINYPQARRLIIELLKRERA